MSVVIEGYKTGIFLVVAAGQLKFCINRPVANGNFFEILGSFFEELPHASGPALAYTFGSVAIIVLFKVWIKWKWPGHNVLQYVRFMRYVFFPFVLNTYEYNHSLHFERNFKSRYLAKVYSGNFMQTITYTVM